MSQRTMTTELSAFAVFMLLNCWLIFVCLVQPDRHFDSLISINVSSSNNTGSSGRISCVNSGSCSDEISVGSSLPASSAAGCQILKGRWVPDSTPPLYTNETCKFIPPNRNCLKNGRPDKDFLNWRWKPDECELPLLDPAGLLRTMQGKNMVLIGDSIARNHMHSLLCALAQVEDPENLEPATEWRQAGKWRFRSHNFTLEHKWSPFLIKHELVNETFHVHLDVADDSWASALHDYDVAVISTGYWYHRPSVYYTNGSIMGCNINNRYPSSSSLKNYTIVESQQAFRIAHRYVLKHMLQSYKGITLLRTVTMDHFENGSWVTGGFCNRTRPFSEMDSPRLSWMNNEMNKIQVEEFERAVSNSNSIESNHSWRLVLLDVTWSALMRPDGHPNGYTVHQNDCLHWCLPGPIDMWNQLVWDTLRKKMPSN